MYIRIATYPLREGLRLEDWIREHAEEVRSAPGVHTVEFIKSTENDRYVGAIIRFQTLDDMHRYQESDIYWSITNDLRENWVEPALEIRRGHYVSVTD